MENEGCLCGQPFCFTTPIYTKICCFSGKTDIFDNARKALEPKGVSYYNDEVNQYRFLQGRVKVPTGGKSPRPDVFCALADSV